MTKKNVGELSHEANSDSNSYCAFDIADEMVKDIYDQVKECIVKHENHFDSDEFCVVMLLAKDPILKNIIRRKFYAWPFLPKPRPNQTVWLYNKPKDTLKSLWCLPASDALATLSVLVNVHPEYKKMQKWANWFYTTKFWENIRKESETKMLSEEEHLEVMTKKGTHLGADDLSPTVTNPIDCMKVDTK